MPRVRRVEANIPKSAVAPTVAPGTDWRPIRESTYIAVMAKTTARTVCSGGIAVVPIQPLPPYLLAMAWQREEQAAAAHRCLTHLQRYRDRYAWISQPQ